VHTSRTFSMQGSITSEGYGRKMGLPDAYGHSGKHQRSQAKDPDNHACRLLAELFADLGGKRRKKAENLY